MTPDPTVEYSCRVCRAFSRVVLSQSETIEALRAELATTRAQRDEAQKDSARLDWMDRDCLKMSVSVGVFTDGVLGLGRGHVVDAKWTHKSKGYSSLRAAIDAARVSEPIRPDESQNEVRTFKHLLTNKSGETLLTNHAPECGANDGGRCDCGLTSVARPDGTTEGGA